MSGAMGWCYRSCPALPAVIAFATGCACWRTVACVEEARGADGLVFHMKDVSMCMVLSQDTRFRSGSNNHNLPARMRSVDHEPALHMPVSRWRLLPLIGSVDVAEKQGWSMSAL